MSTSIPQEPEDVKEEVCAVEWCAEEVFREGLCWEHFVEEKIADWDAEDAERRAQLNGVGCYLFGDLEPALDGGWWGYKKEDIYHESE